MYSSMTLHVNMLGDFLDQDRAIPLYPENGYFVPLLSGQYCHPWYPSPQLLSSEQLF